ncbi:MAG: MerR family DNA-binding protein [Gemmatimonadetes bacterium]|nr:MerR family DNA-binding protein [Gemmatimonadota bacterium]
MALITLGRSAGLTLDEIGQMLTVGGRAKVDRQLLTDRADAIDDVA